MDFLERYFGLSGDYGDGSHEAILLLVPLIIITATVMVFFQKRYERH
jgi:hypothetical protein